jgi:hypothetical protein
MSVLDETSRNALDGAGSFCFSEKPDPLQPNDIVGDPGLLEQLGEIRSR